MRFKLQVEYETTTGYYHVEVFRIGHLPSHPDPYIGERSGTSVVNALEDAAALAANYTREVKAQGAERGK